MLLSLRFIFVITSDLEMLVVCLFLFFKKNKSIVLGPPVSN